MSSVAKQKTGEQPGWISSMFQFGLYKPSQGRVVRQVTAVAIGVVVLLAAYELGWAGWVARLGRDRLDFPQLPYLVFLVLGMLGLWIAFRLVNVPKFADFMIAVEAEMKKVSWPTRTELWRASFVVIFVIFFMAALLYLFDFVWTWFFQLIGIRIG